MCGRFSQSMTREDYLALLAEETERDIHLPRNRSVILQWRTAQKFSC